jgi:hypothetical protein
MMDLATLEREALNLDAKSRGHLASVLLRSLDERDENFLDEEIEQAWLIEVERRGREMEFGEVKGISHEDVMREVRSLLK